MMALYGEKAYDFVPKTFSYPLEIDSLKKDMKKRPNQYWIFKPCASSQGRGIFVTNSLEDIPQKHNYVVSEYISRPLLINGLKFDLRIYVAITSVNPLRIYVYDEGLARFATEKYDDGFRNIKNVFSHLTNYSINKKNIERFVRPES
jgi:tubulin polyglutamylase TTLL5